MKRTILAVAAVAFGLFGMGFGVAEAVSATAIPPNTIHGCVVGKSRTLEQVYTNSANGTVCAAGQQVVFPKGATTAGPTGLDVIEVQSQTVQVSPHNGFAARCPADHPYVLSGGYTTADDATVMQSLPIGPTGGAPNFPQTWGVWLGSFPSGGVGTRPLQVYALCAK